MRMARIMNFMYCENVQNENTPVGPRNNIIGPITTIRPMFIPGTFSFSIFTSLLEVNIEETHTIRIVFTNGTKDIIDTQNVNIPIHNSEDDLPESELGFMISMDFRNIIFEKEGYHTSKVYFDNIPIGEFPIYVKVAKNVKTN